jgi:hypothetical protein
VPSASGSGACWSRSATSGVARGYPHPIEAVIGHLRERHRMGRNHLAHASGEAMNAVLAAVGYNFRRLLAWLRFLLLRILIALGLAAQFKLA